MGNRIPSTGAALQDTTAFACLYDTNKSYDAADKAYKESKSKLTSFGALCNRMVFSSIKYAATGVVAGVQAVAFTALAAAATAAQVPAFLLGTKKPWDAAKQCADKAHASVIIVALAFFGVVFSSRTVAAVNNAADATNAAVPAAAAESADNLKALADAKEKAIAERNQKEEVDAKVYKDFVYTQFIKPVEGTKDDKPKGHNKLILEKFEQTKKDHLAAVKVKDGDTVDPNAGISKLFVAARKAIQDIKAYNSLAKNLIEQVPTNAVEFAKYKFKHIAEKRAKNDADRFIEAMKQQAEEKFQAMAKALNDKKAALGKDDKDGHQKADEALKELQALKAKFVSDYTAAISGEDGVYNKAFKVGKVQDKDGVPQPVLDFEAYQKAGGDIDIDYPNFRRELKAKQTEYAARLNNNFIEPPKPDPAIVLAPAPAGNGAVTGASGNGFRKAVSGMWETTRGYASGFFKRVGGFLPSDEAAA